MRVEVDKYEIAVAWLRDLIYGSEFDKERYVHVLTCIYSEEESDFWGGLCWVGAGAIGYRSMWRRFSRRFLG